MTVRLGIVMDPIQDIHFKKDSSLAMLHAAQKRGWEIEYMELPDLYLAGGALLWRAGQFSAGWPWPNHGSSQGLTWNVLACVRT